MKTKKQATRLIALLLVLAAAFAAGCNGGTSPAAPPGAPAPDTASPASPTNSGNNTPSNSGNNTPADTTPDGPDYESMTLEELYELTLLEEGTITIYSTTANAYTIVKRIEADYPDLKGKFVYIECDTNNIQDRIVMEYESGNINADVMQVKDNSGEIFYELVDYGYVEIYQPKSVTPHIDPALLKYGMPLYASFNPWYYSTGMYPDGCPLTSWWDIVEGYNTDTKSYTDSSGKNTQFWTIFTKDITSPSYAALWAQLIVDGDAMAVQYEKQFGHPLEYTYHDKLANTPGIMDFPENNGGVELFWRFSQMKTTELDDGDAVVNAVDSSLSGPTLGLASAGKRDNINSGAKIDWVTGLQPYTAFMTCDYLYIVDGSDNPAGSRFFILYSLGGEDGHGGGLDTFSNRGTYWSIRDDYEFTSPHTLDAVNLKGPDFDEIYYTFPNVKAYWLYWRSLL